MMTLGFAVVYGCSELVFAGWTTAGLRGLAQFHNFYASCTPAEFWRRYNRPVTKFMFENVFRPAGGARTPIRATLAAFFVSGVIHEYIAGIALQSIQGYQLAFFMIQGVAVVATARLAPRGTVAVAAAVTATIIFNILVSLVFCATAAQLFDLYSDNAPAWMPTR
jgi:D-alanyl-lipoteichoic acid acyltransferase DltB (MBOAT superfamily)